MHFFWKFLGKATTLVFYKVQHRAYNCLRVRIILHLSVLITGTSIKTFYICYSSPHLKIWFYSVSYSYYIIYFTLESLFNAPTVSKYIFNAYHQPSLCVLLSLWLSESHSLLDSLGRNHENSISCLACLLVYPYSFILEVQFYWMLNPWLTVSLEYLYIIFGITCCSPSVTDDLSFFPS